MTFEEALRIKIGDKIYTHFGEIVVVAGWIHNLENPCIKDDLYFHCIDTSFRTLRYRYDELCGPELCDEDKMFIDWHNEFCPENQNMTSFLKKAFMKGFELGFSHKQRILSEDQLQK